MSDGQVKKQWQIVRQTKLGVQTTMWLPAIVRARDGEDLIWSTDWQFTQKGGKRRRKNMYQLTGWGAWCPDGSRHRQPHILSASHALLFHNQEGRLHWAIDLPFRSIVRDLLICQLPELRTVLEAWWARGKYLRVYLHASTQGNNSRAAVSKVFGGNCTYLLICIFTRVTARFCKLRRFQDPIPRAVWMLFLSKQQLKLLSSSFRVVNRND